MPRFCLKETILDWTKLLIRLLIRSCASGFIEERLDNDDKFIETKTPHLEYQDKLYNGLLAIEAVIGSVEMYAGHETTFKAHLHAVKEMLEARIDA